MAWAGRLRQVFARRRPSGGSRAPGNASPVPLTATAHPTVGTSPEMWGALLVLARLRRARRARGSGR